MNKVRHSISQLGITAAAAAVAARVTAPLYLEEPRAAVAVHPFPVGGDSHRRRAPGRTQLTLQPRCRGHVEGACLAKPAHTHTKVDIVKHISSRL